VHANSNMWNTHETAARKKKSSAASVKGPVAAERVPQDLRPSVFCGLPCLVDDQNLHRLASRHQSESQLILEG
jgi:hypothetical protein